jgi:methionine synthase I (cobalamin-dependent)
MATNDLHPLETLLRERIVFLDGAMGTMIQQCKLSEAEEDGFPIGKAKTSRAAWNCLI